MMRQSGFTLVELLVSLSLMGMVATGSASAIFSLLKANRHVSATLPSLNSIQIAGHWISRDVQTASRTDLVDGAAPVNPSVTPVNFYRTDYYIYPPVSHTTTYTFNNGELQRNYDGQITTVARSISAGTFYFEGRMVTVVISASGLDRTYQIHLRPN